MAAYTHDLTSPKIQAAPDVRSIRNSIVTTSWDDGDPLDLKLAEMLAKYTVPATFYLVIDNYERRCLDRPQIQRIARNFDVGAHSYHHFDLTKIPVGQAQNEILDGKVELEQITGRNISSFCYPMGKYNRAVVQLVKAAGFNGARTIQINTRHIPDCFKAGTMVNARNYSPVRHFRHSVAALDLNLTLFILQKNLCFKNWDQIAIQTLDFVVNHGGIWHLWGHSWEVDENRDWEKLRQVFQMIASLPPQVSKLNNTELLQMYRQPGS
jgi:peptidoglycan-N-acetylglucosamine deacetylase